MCLGLRKVGCYDVPLVSGHCPVSSLSIMAQRPGVACPLAHAYFEANSAHYEAKTARSGPNLPVILMSCPNQGENTSPWA